MASVKRKRNELQSNSSSESEALIDDFEEGKSKACPKPSKLLKADNENNNDSDNGNVDEKDDNSENMEENDNQKAKWKTVPLEKRDKKAKKADVELSGDDNAEEHEDDDAEEEDNQEVRKKQRTKKNTAKVR